MPLNRRILTTLPSGSVDVTIKRQEVPHPNRAQYADAMEISNALGVFLKSQ